MTAEPSPEIIDHLLGAYLSGFTSGVVTRGLGGAPSEDADVLAHERILAHRWAHRIYNDPLARSEVVASLVAAWRGTPLPPAILGPIL